MQVLKRKAPQRAVRQIEKAAALELKAAAQRAAAAMIAAIKESKPSPSAYRMAAIPVPLKKEAGHSQELGPMDLQTDGPPAQPDEKTQETFLAKTAAEHARDRAERWGRGLGYSDAQLEEFIKTEPLHVAAVQKLEALKGT